MNKTANQYDQSVTLLLRKNNYLGKFSLMASPLFFLLSEILHPITESETSKEHLPKTFSIISASKASPQVTIQIF